MKIELREGAVHLEGYVNAVERWSNPIPDRFGVFVERIMPGAFSHSLERECGIPVLLNHRKNKELANTADGSARLREDSIGLKIAMETSDPDVMQDAKAGRLRGWSFGFRDGNKIEEDTNDKGCRTRSVYELELTEVSLINGEKVPAYAATSVEIRDDGQEERIETRCRICSTEDIVTTGIPETPPPPAEPVDLSKERAMLEEFKKGGLTND